MQINAAESDPLPSKINIEEEMGDEKEEKIAAIRSPSRKKEKRSENSKMREFEILAQKGGGRSEGGRNERASFPEYRRDFFPSPWHGGRMAGSTLEMIITTASHAGERTKDCLRCFPLLESRKTSFPICFLNVPCRNYFKK